MCVFFDAGWLPLHPTNWKQAGGEGVYWSFAGVRDFAELVQVLSRDTLSVHWMRRPTGMERVLSATFPPSSRICDFSTNVRTTPCTVRCSRQLRARVGRRLVSRGCPASIWMKAASGAGRSVHQICSCPVTNAFPHDNIRKSQHLFQRAKWEKNACFWSRGVVPAEGWRCLRRGMWSNHA